MTHSTSRCYIDFTKTIKTLIPDGGGDDGRGALASYNNQSPDDGRSHATTSGIAAIKSTTVENPSVLYDKSVPITLCKRIT